MSKPMTVSIKHEPVSDKNWSATEAVKENIIQHVWIASADTNNIYRQSPIGSNAQKQQKMLLSSRSTTELGIITFS